MATLTRKSIDSLLSGSALSFGGKAGAYILTNRYAQKVVFRAKTLSEIRHQITVILGR